MKEPIAYSDILLFQQSADGYVFVYYESYEPKVKVFSEEGRVKSEGRNSPARSSTNYTNLTNQREAGLKIEK